MAPFDTLQRTLEALVRAEGNTFKERVEFLIQDGTIPAEEGAAHHLWAGSMDKMNIIGSKLRDFRLASDRELRQRSSR